MLRCALATSSISLWNSGTVHDHKGVNKISLALHISWLPVAEYMITNTQTFLTVCTFTQCYRLILSWIISQDFIFHWSLKRSYQRRIGLSCIFHRFRICFSFLGLQWELLFYPLLDDAQQRVLVLWERGPAQSIRVHAAQLGQPSRTSVRPIGGPLCQLTQRHSRHVLVWLLKLWSLLAGCPLYGLAFRWSFTYRCHAMFCWT